MNNATATQIRTLVRTYLTWSPNTQESWGGGRRGHEKKTSLAGIVAAVDYLYHGQHGSEPFNASDLEYATREIVRDMVGAAEITVVPSGITPEHDTHEIAVRTTGQRLANQYCEQSSQPRYRNTQLDNQGR
jgi:hypothetical protein